MKKDTLVIWLCAVVILVCTAIVCWEHLKRHREEESREVERFQRFMDVKMRGIKRNILSGKEYFNVDKP